jgi:hypothetical protein
VNFDRHVARMRAANERAMMDAHGSERTVP